ncbi:MAG: DNA primase [Gammaproteobacteria bacterium]|nr:DNA primase [Gammaproteobacteria bacterium]
MDGRISQSFIDELLTRVDIVDIVDARVPLTRAGGGEFKARCPFHDEKTPSFTVSQRKQFYHCFGCGAHGTAIGFLMQYSHMDFPEAVENLAALAGVEVQRESGGRGVIGGGNGDGEAVKARQNLYDAIDEAGKFFRDMLRKHPQAGEAIDYLKGRGLSGQTVANFGIGYAPDGYDNLRSALGGTEEKKQCLITAGLLKKNESGKVYDRFRRRVMFPIVDYRGRVVAFGGRIIGDGKPKYLNSPETAVFSKGAELYGLHRARSKGALQKSRRCLVVEGYMDVVSLAEHGIPNAVATLGTATTDRHLARLFRVVDEVVFCFDGDRAGRAAAWKALQVCLPLLKDAQSASFLLLTGGDDPDTVVRKAGAGEMQKRIAAAKPLPAFLLQHLRESVDLNQLDGPARLAELARPLVARMGQEVLQQVVSDRLAALAGLSAVEMARSLGVGRRTLQRAGAGTVSPGAGTAPPDSGIAPAGAKLSPVARAISMLVQQPALAQLVPADADLRAAGTPGAELLAELVEALRERPKLGTAALVERYRGTANFPHLEKLASWDHLLPDKFEPEFRGILKKLLKTWPRRREIDRLLAKNSADGLSPAEKERLKTLMKAAGKDKAAAGA